MKNKKGFTLVELLAVIAILAILVIIAMPNVLKQLRNARQSAFDTEIKTIASEVDKQFISDSISNPTNYDTKIYTNIDGESGKELDISGGENVKYSISVDSQGKITCFKATNGSYYYDAPSGIDDKSTMSSIEINDENKFDITKDNCSGGTTSKPKIKLTDSDGDGKADVGEKVCISTECFYIISNDGTNVKALAEWNLLVGDQWDGTITNLANPTGLQDSSAIGMHWSVSHASFESSVVYPSIGVTSFGVVDGYIDEYKIKLESFGATINYISLITKEELISLGCSTTNQTCIEAQPWVYQTSYRTISNYDSSGAQFRWRVYSNGDFNAGNSYYNYMELGVRPVITILASNINVG